MIAAERKYSLHRVRAGDYLLPSNDGRTIWRLMRYEDGPSHGLDDMPRDREFWGVWKWMGPVEVGAFVDVEDWDRWMMVESRYATRAEAVRSALDQEGTR